VNPVDAEEGGGKVSVDAIAEAIRDP